MFNLSTILRFTIKVLKKAATEIKDTELQFKSRNTQPNIESKKMHLQNIN